MKLRSFGRLAFGLAFAVIVGSGSALADGHKVVDGVPTDLYSRGNDDLYGSASSRPPENTFCPAGSGRACWIFGCWCETPSLSYVQAANCDPHKLPQMAPWTFNIYLDTDSACPAPVTAQPQAPSSAVMAIPHY